jgi:subtilisin family serine protease
MNNLCKGIALLLLACASITSPSCNNIPSIDPTKKQTVTRWVNWVGVIDKKSDSNQRKAIIDSVKEQLRKVNSLLYPGTDSTSPPITYTLFKRLQDSLGTNAKFYLDSVRERMCNCGDSLLFNVVADLIFEGTSGSVGGTQVPPPTKPGVQGLDVLANNDMVSDPGVFNAVINNGNPLKFRPGYKSENTAVIAIVDTGLDTLLFAPANRKDILWNGPNGSKNFVEGANVNDYRDDHVIRHGSVVTGIALNSFYKMTKSYALPKVMALKALDQNGKGNIFDIVCAINYAIINHATAINLSLGYYGEANPSLEYYLRQSKIDSIPVITAAGNTSGQRDTATSVCEDQINNSNELKPGHLFYPACSNNPESFLVIAVTGFSSPGIPCFYQNYSKEYVNLAVLNRLSETNCCSYTLDFINSPFSLEGSSFATPVVSGEVAAVIMKSGKDVSANAYVRRLNALSAPVTGSNPEVTIQNMYIPY